jgi:hypothetical protein
MGKSKVNLSPLLLEITFNSDPRGLRVTNGEVIKLPDSAPFWGMWGGGWGWGGGLVFPHLVYFFEEYGVDVRET